MEQVENNLARGALCRLTSHFRKTTGLTILLRVAENAANQFDHSSGNSEEESNHADPRSVKPAVKGGAKKPSGYRAGREHECQLAVAPDLHPGVFFLVRVAVIGGTGGHSGARSKPILS